MSLLESYVDLLVDTLEGHNLEYDDAGWTRYGLNTKDDNLTKEQLEQMTPDDAKSLYLEKLTPLFTSFKAELGFEGVAIVLLDVHVLQGDMTVKIVRDYVYRHRPQSDAVAIALATYRRMMNFERVVDSNPNLNIYYNGWLKRALKISAKVLEWINEL